jgi:RNA polymerase sigma-70 factor (ECF subfamily)
MAKRQPTDEELMLAYQGGDVKAFEELFARYKTRLFNYLRRALGDPVQAEDLFQTLFLRVHRARGTYRPTAAFSTWVYTIARNLVRDAVDKKAVEEREEPKNLSEGGEESLSLTERVGNERYAPETLFRQKETITLLQQAFFSLSPEQREMILLSKYEGLSFPRIAEILGCSVSAAKVRAFRALKVLRAALGDIEK